MKAEKIILSFVSVVLGLLVAGGIFFIYQSTKAINPTKTKTISIHPPTPTPQTGFFLSIETPPDEKTVSSKNITVSGKTTPDATIVVITPTDQQVVKPATNGNFSVSTTISDNENEIEITAIAATGEEKKVTRTVSFTSADF